MRPRYVAVAEDHEDSREMLCELLRHAGWTPICAATAWEALTLLSFHPEALILDLSFPSLEEGCSLVRQICSRPETPPVIALNGWGLQDYSERARAAGSSVVLVKPVDPALLLEVLGRLSSSVAS